MQGVGHPYILGKTGVSPHYQTLKPSDIKNLRTVDLFFWIGPTLENRLAKGIQTHAPKQCVYEILSLKGLTPLQKRQEQCAHTHKNPRPSVPLEQGTLDPHVWLDPTRMALITSFMAKKLIEVDPAHQDLYKKNENRIQKALHQLHSDIKKRLVSLKNKPFFIHHDGFQYFEKAYELKEGRFLLKRVAGQATLKHLDYLQHTHDQEKVVFGEKQFVSKLSQAFAKKTHILYMEVDSLGKEGTDENAYLDMMRHLAEKFSQGLQGEKTCHHEK